MSMSRRWGIVMAVVGMLGVRDAGAREIIVTSDETIVREVPASRIGVLLEAGGGVTNYAQQQLRDMTSVGGEWDVRLALGTRSFVGGEVAYVGASNRLNAFGASDNSSLMRNGIETELRINLPLALGRRLLLEPYLHGGVGWTRFDLVHTDVNLTTLSRSDDQLVVPVGAGFLLGFHHLGLDLRGTYRPTFYDNLVRLATNGNGNRGADNWSLNLNIGYEL